MFTLLEVDIKLTWVAVFRCEL